MSSPRRYFKELRFRQLRALVELARKGSFTAVAETLQMSVPSVWQQIKALEDEFGAAMVQQSGKTAVLTPQGELLVQLSQPLVESFDRIRELFADQNQKLARRITVATTASLLLHELQKPLELYRKRHPDVQLSFIDRPSTMARKHLEDGEADVAIVGQIDAPQHPRIAATPVTAYPFVLVCPEGHPLLKAKTLKLADLIKQPLVLPGTGANSRRHVQDVFEAAALWQKANIALTASTFEIVVGYVRMGFGISITSVSPMILKEAAQGHSSYRGVAFRDLSKLFGREEVVVLHRKAKVELPHHLAFRDIVVKAMVRNEK
jgi:molybdate transport repressor ModE-like protein